MAVKFRDPPSLIGPDGEMRRIGVEIEFAALSALDVAHRVQSLFGGEIIEKNAHRFEVEGTKLGTFLAELDTSYAHPEDAAGGVETDPGSLLSRFRAGIATAIGNVSSAVVPCEIVCPPIELRRLNELNLLVGTLEDAGAKGTRDSLLYAFGTHLNPEIASDDSAYLTSVLKAYVLLSDWLRVDLDIDVSRRIMSYTDPFPEAYVTKILASDYWPDQSTLISDYLVDNPTRNRELDMLPLFAWLDRGAVEATIEDHRIGARPTFHYRLPNANLRAADNPLVKEWNRWCEVEHLANDEEKIMAMAAAFVERSQAKSGDWASRTSEWLNR